MLCYKEGCDSKRLRVETVLKRSQHMHLGVNVLDLIVLLLVCPEVWLGFENFTNVVGSINISPHHL